jgi:hypothetical protein
MTTFRHIGIRAAALLATFAFVAVEAAPRIRF